MRFQFGANAYVEEAFGLPAITLENFQAETLADRGDWPYRLIPTPGTISRATFGTGIGRGMFQSDGVLGGDIVAIRGAQAARVTSGYVVSVLTGTIADDGRPVPMAASQTPELIAVSNGSAYQVLTGSVASFSWTGPTGPIGDVTEINQIHLYLEEQSGRVWYSDRADATTVGANSFITAESEPDRLIGLTVYGETIALFGTQTIELWRETGDVDVPLVRRPGGVIPRGIIGRDAKTVADFGLFMVGDNSVVYRFQDFQPVRISTHAIERQITALTSANKAKVRLSTYSVEGHEYVHLHIPETADYFYDAATRSWHRRKKIGNEQPCYEYDFYVEAFGEVFAQDVADGRIVEIDRNTYTHNGEAIRRIATALIPINSRPLEIANLVIYGQGGTGLDGGGQGSSPVGWVQLSSNGKIYGNELIRSLGTLGDYDWRPSWTPLGTWKPPQMFIQFGMSDPVGYAINGAQLNVERI